MLVLSRRVGERLMIGDDIVVTILEVRSDGVRLGIDAPRSIAVNRAEVLEAVKEANVAAIAATDAAVETLRQLIPARRRPAALKVVAPEPEPPAAPAAPAAEVPEPAAEPELERAAEPEPTSPPVPEPPAEAEPAAAKPKPSTPPHPTARRPPGIGA